MSKLHVSEHHVCNALGTQENLWHSVAGETPHYKYTIATWDCAYARQSIGRISHN